MPLPRPLVNINDQEDPAVTMSGFQPIYRSPRLSRFFHYHDQRVSKNRIQHTSLVRQVPERLLGPKSDLPLEAKDRQQTVDRERQLGYDDIHIAPQNLLRLQIHAF